MVREQSENKKTYTILLVEDDSLLRNMYTQALVSHGYKILKASDGQEALDLFNKEKIDLIITDLMMPRMSGVEFLQEVRKTPQGQTIPAIAWSNLTFEEEKTQALSAGANEYIVKDSLPVEQIVDVIKKYLS